MRFDKPIITPPELEIALELRPWDDYILDEF
jgi:diphthamide synthase subunit DPH2